MAVFRSKYQEMLDKLQEENKVKPLEAIIDRKTTQEINTEMEAVRRDYRRKDVESRQAAAQIILNA